MAITLQPDHQTPMPRPDHEAQALKAARVMVDEVIDRGFTARQAIDVLVSAAIMSLCCLERLEGPVDRGAVYARIERGASRAAQLPGQSHHIGHA